MPDRRHRIRVCPYCGSEDIVPKILFGGPLAGVDNKDESYVCRNCGVRAVPIDFEEEMEAKDFRNEKIMNVYEEPDRKDFLHIPILPLDTASPFRLGGFDNPIGKTAEVVDLFWKGNHFARGEYRAPFLHYWRAISGSRYNAEHIFLMDLAGIEEGRPNFRALKKLIKRRYEIWLDLGMRSLQDLFDSFALDISWAVAGSLTLPGTRLFEEIYELSDRCIPCLYLDGKVIWPRRVGAQDDPERIIRFLERIGFESVAVLDLRRLGTRTGADRSLLRRLEGADPAIFVGGGVTEGDLVLMEEKGFTGALMDPFTPAIRNILEEEEGVTEQAECAPMDEVPSRIDRSDVLPSD